jgi:hypothetical protein
VKAWLARAVANTALRGEQDRNRLARWSGWFASTPAVDETRFQGADDPTRATGVSFPTPGRAPTRTSPRSRRNSWRRSQTYRGRGGTWWSRGTCGGTVLPADWRAGFEAHLAGCGGCTEYVRQIRLTVKALQASDSQWPTDTQRGGRTHHLSGDVTVQSPLPTHIDREGGHHAS